MAADVWRVRQESNLYQELRRLSFYPLNYGRAGSYYTRRYYSGQHARKPSIVACLVSTHPADVANIAANLNQYELCFR